MTQTSFENPIGVFDSGSGGLTILQSVLDILPHESFIYLGDHAYNPYGNKTTTFIRERTVAAIRFFLSRQAKLVVIACNTATIAGIDWYREQFPTLPIVGVVPVIKTAAALSKTKHFIVLSTEYTANSTYQKELISKFGEHCTVTSLGSSVLVPLIEKGILRGPEVESELHTLLATFSPDIFDVIVLGCTHYPFLKPVLRAMIGEGVHILDSGGAVARQVSRILSERNALSQNSLRTVEYCTTGDVQTVQKLFSVLLQHEVSVEHIMV